MSDVFSRTLGASNHTDKDRAAYDYYATEPKAVEKLLDMVHAKIPVLFDDIWSEYHEL